MSWTLIVGVAFLALLVLEWWFRSRVVHVFTVMAALGLLLFSAPMPYRALRRAVEMEPVANNLWNPSRKATEFESGMFTMYQAMVNDTAMQAGERAVYLSVLTWLTISPLLWRRPRIASGAVPREDSSVASPSGLTSA